MSGDAMGEEILVIEGVAVDEDDALEAALTTLNDHGFSVTRAVRYHGTISTVRS